MAVSVEALQRGLEQRAIDMVTRLADEFVSEVQSNASRRTGKTAESVQADTPEVSRDLVTVHVEVHEPSGRYQDEGTGIYGPEGTRIYPKHAKALRFDWPAAGGIVIVRSVAGMEGTRFWSRAVESWPTIVRRVGSGG